MSIALIVDLLLNSTIMAGILFFPILIVKRVFRNLISAKWHYIIWFIFILRLAVPYVAYSPFNLSDIYKAADIESGVIDDKAPQNASNAFVSQDVKGAREVTDLVGSGNKSPNANIRRFSLSNILKKFIATINKINFDHSILFLIWLVGVIVFSLYSFLFNIYFWSRVKNGKAFIEQNVIGLLEDCKEELGVKTNVSIIKTSGVNIPAIFGVTRPWLLMPEKVLAGLKTEKLRFVILHELAHLKRRDIVVNWLAFILQIIHWFNPLVWLAFYRMRLDRELACDEAVLTHLEPDEATKYGHTILDMAEIVSQRVSYAGIAGILENKSRLRDRIIMISRSADRNKPIPFTGVVIALLLASSVLVNAGDYIGNTELKANSANIEINMDDGNAGNAQNMAVSTRDAGNAQAPGSTQGPGSVQTAETNASGVDSAAGAGDNANTDAPKVSGEGIEQQRTEPNSSESGRKPPSSQAGSAGEIVGAVSANEVSEKPESGDGESKTTGAGTGDIVVKANPPVIDAGIEQTGTRGQEADAENGQVGSLGLKVTEGITVTAESSEYFAIYIDKSKLPPELPEGISMFMITTNDISDYNISSMAYRYMTLKCNNMPFVGKPVEYFHFQKNDNYYTKYIVIFIYDTDFNYLGYFIHEIPLN